MQLFIVRLFDILKLARVDEMVVVYVTFWAAGFAFEPTLTLLQVRVPFPVIEHELLELVKLFNVTNEVTVSVTPLLIDKLAFTPVNVIEAHVALMSQVRLMALGITTGSFVAGI